MANITAIQWCQWECLAGSPRKSCPNNAFLDECFNRCLKVGCPPMSSRRVPVHGNLWLHFIAFYICLFLLTTFFIGLPVLLARKLSSYICPRQAPEDKPFKYALMTVLLLMSFGFTVALGPYLDNKQTNSELCGAIVVCVCIIWHFWNSLPL